jgi:TP901 family phage tail tape measure protein
MAKAFQIAFQIGGKLAGSFSSSFSKASSSMTHLSNRARQTQRALDQLGNDFRNGRIHQTQYAEATERLTRELRALDRAQKRISTMKTMFGNGLNTAKYVAGIAAVATATAAAGVAYNSMNKAADFQSKITKAGVIADASASDMKRLSATALELGANSSLTASEVAVAMKELAAKGMDTNKVIGAMPGILHAAEASGEDLALTSNVVVSALNAFGLKATDANHVADVMAMSANKSAAGVEDLGYAFKYAAPVAKTLGISLEELASSTGIMVDKGLSGEQAGTSLRMALIRLAKPPKAARKALDALNLSVTDSHGKFKGIARISEDWNKATKKLTQTQKVQYAAQVFGVEAATGMLNLFSAGPKKINEMTKALENSGGSAEKAAKAMKDNYGGALERLKGSIETAQIKFATPILPVFQDVFEGVSSSLTNNMGGIENAGKRVAATLAHIFEPFSAAKKPVFDPTNQNPDYKDYYRTELGKYNKYDGMDFGDRAVEMLENGADKIDKWMSGSGGDSMDKIFTKLGELAGKAWWIAFKTSISTSTRNLMDGNFSAALASGVAANTLTGGALLSGGAFATMMAYNLLKNGRTPPVPPTPIPPVPPPTPPPGGGGGVLKKILGPLGELLAFKGIDDGSRSLFDRAFGHDKGDIKSKPLFSNPLDFKTHRYNDSRQGAVQKFFGFGTQAPQTNTAVASQPVETRVLNDSSNPYANKYKVFGQQPVDTTQASTALNQSTTELKTAVTLSTTNFNILGTYAGQASGWIVASFTGIKTSADLVKTNLDLLTMYTGQASGWLASLNGIQSAGQRVITALNNLESRINNVKLPTPSKRVSFDG